VPRERGRKSITVLAGPARCGKTLRVVALAAEALRRTRRPLVIVPDAPAASRMRRLILGELPALLTSAVTTFVGLAQRILAAALVETKAISFHDRELLLRQIVSDLHASGFLKYFAGVVEFDGFYAGLALFLRELKACQIDPETFAAAAFKKTRRDRELAEIYRLYQKALREGDLYDGEGRFWEARLALEKTEPLGLDCSDLFIDGFSDFTANEMVLLGALSRHVASITVTLPYEDRRPALFTKTFQTLERLKQDFAVRMEELPAPEAPGPAARISKLFMAGDAAPAGTPPGGVRFISTAGARMEMEEIAREAKRLILSGVSPCDIAVVTRDLRGYGSLAREAFARMRVPLSCAADFEPERSGLFSLLVLAVDLIEGDFDRESVVKSLSSPYVDLVAFVGGALTRAEVRRLARQAGVVKGLRQWEVRLASLEAELESRREGARLADEADEDAAVALAAQDVPRIELLREGVRRLKDLVWPLAASAPPATFAARFKAVIETLGVPRRILVDGLDEEVLLRDLAAYAAIVDTLDVLSRSGRAAVPMSARAFLQLLRRTAEARGPSSGELSAAGVNLIDVVTARNLSFPVVFLCGLVADAFPSPLPVNSFYSRPEREQLARLGLVTRTEQSHLAAERLLFYQAVTRADTTLYVTYPATDEAGRPQLASFYLDELESILASSDADRRHYGPSRVVTPLEEAASPLEAAISAAVFVGKCEKMEELASAAGAAQSVYPAFGAALRGASIEARRESLVGFDNFDGRLSAPAAAAVAARFGRGAAWSGSALSDYRGCPFSFFLSRVLLAERPEEPDVVPTPLARGGIAHEVLARFFTEVRDAGKTPLLFEGDPAAFDKDFDRVFASVAGARERRLGLGGEAFWMMEKSRLHAMLRAFVEDEISRLSKEKVRYMPAFFELSFGPRRASRGEIEDVSSTAVPVFVEKDGRREALVGRIDRVDIVDGSARRNAAGAAHRVLILDYKLSRAPTLASVDKFIDMQMPVYLYAAPAVLPAAGEVLPVGALYRTVSGAGGRKPVKSFEKAEAYAAWRRAFAEVVFETADLIRGGFFAAVPSGDCPPFCIGRGVCRYSQARLEFLEKADE